MDEEWTKQLTSAIVSFHCFLLPEENFLLFFCVCVCDYGVKVNQSTRKEACGMEIWILLLHLLFFSPAMNEKSISAFQKSLVAVPSFLLGGRCSRSQTSCNEHATSESPHKSPLERAQGIPWTI